MVEETRATTVPVRPVLLRELLTVGHMLCFIVKLVLEAFLGVRDDQVFLGGG